MTALCVSGGPSRVKGGVDPVVAVSSAAMQAAMQRSGNAWLVAVSALLALPSIVTADFCPLDPPGFQSMNATEVALAFQPILNTQAVLDAREKIGNNILTLAWYALCECVSGTQPVQPATSMTPPTNLPIPAGGGTGVQACYTLTPNAVLISSGHSLALNYLLSKFGALTADPLPTLGTVTLTNAIQSGAGATVDITHQAVATPGASGSSSIVRLTPGQSHTWTDVLDATGTGNGISFGVQYISGDVARVSGVGLFYCNNQSPTTLAGPCPTDPAVLAMLDSIFQLVTLIQRQIVPFSYISGPIHSGLTGTGSVTVTSIMGVLLNVSVPSRAGEIAGTPPVVFDCGWVTFGDANGYSVRKQIRSDSQVIFPEVAGLWREVGYTLLPGVTMALTELRREL